MNDTELIAQQVARLTRQLDEATRRLGDAENRHAALRAEYDEFRESVFEQLGIRALRSLRMRGVRI